MMTEIQTIEGGQKDALLRRANIKKKKKNKNKTTKTLFVDAIADLL